MTSASKNLSDPSFPWDAWDRAEQRLQRILAGSNLPTALQEIASDAVFWRFVTCWGRDLPIRNLPAWVSSVLRNELWHLRRRGIPHQLGGLDTSHVQEIQATSEGRPSPELRSLLQANEGGFLSKLSNQERAVYDQIRRNHSLRECAHNLDMSVRDVRTRFRRIRKKLNGILGHLVPPLLVSEFSRHAHDSIEVQQPKESNAQDRYRVFVFGGRRGAAHPSKVRRIRHCRAHAPC